MTRERKEKKTGSQSKRDPEVSKMPVKADPMLGGGGGAHKDREEKRPQRLKRTAAPSVFHNPTLVSVPKILTGSVGRQNTVILSINFVVPFLLRDPSRRSTQFLVLRYIGSTFRSATNFLSLAAAFGGGGRPTTIFFGGSHHIPVVSLLIPNVLLFCCCVGHVLA